MSKPDWYQGPIPRMPSDYAVKPDGDKLAESIAVFNNFQDAWDFAVLGDLVKCELTQTYQRKQGPSCWDDNGKLIIREEYKPSAGVKQRMLDSDRLKTAQTAIALCHSQVTKLREKTTNKIIAQMVSDMRMRFPKRRIRLMFGMGTHVIEIDGVIRHEGDQNNSYLDSYYDILQNIDEDVWENTGIMHNDVLIEPSI